MSKDRRNNWTPIMTVLMLALAPGCGDDILQTEVALELDPRRATAASAGPDSLLNSLAAKGSLHSPLTAAPPMASTVRASSGSSAKQQHRDRLSISTVQANSGVAFAFEGKRLDARNTPLARHPVQDMNASFTPRGVEVSSRDRSWRLKLSPREIGRAGSSFALSPVSPVVKQNRVEYRRPNLVEWYVHGNLGLQQGFNVHTRPAGGGPLVLTLESSGSVRLRSRAGKAVVLWEEGNKIVQYGNLFAVDSTGRLLPSRLRVSGNRISIEVDDADAVYPLEIDPLLSAQVKLVAQPKGHVDFFGYSVAMDGGVAVVGAHQDDDKASDAGSVYVFQKLSGKWSEKQKLFASDGSVDDLFGRAVAISKDVIVVGALLADPKGTNSGSAYVFRKAASGKWLQEQKLVASDGQPGDRFGQSVSVSGATIVVGAPLANSPSVDAGAAYVFEHVAGTWVQKKKLTASNAVDNGWFGYSVGTDGSSVIVGAPYQGYYIWGARIVKGTIYFFERSTAGWQKGDVIESNKTSDMFGWSVSMDKGIALVGTQEADESGYSSGSASLYKKGGSGWSLVQKLVPSDGAAYDRFGYSVSLKGDKALIGSVLDDDLATNCGSAYLFSFNGSSWVQTQKMVPSDAGYKDNSGLSVAMGQDAVVIGSPLNSTGSVTHGAAYIFQPLAEKGVPCTTGNQCSSGHCVDGVCCNNTCGGNNKYDCQACSTKAGAGQDGYCGALQIGFASKVVCRKKASQCDTPETCVVGSTACPGDLLAALGSICNDGSLSTKNDVCDGSGKCAGTTYTCTPGQCAATSKPDGQGGCKVTYRASGAACSDGKLSTKNDVCDGSGKCAGTTYTCAPKQCDATSKPNGNGGCKVTFKADETPCKQGKCVAGLCVPAPDAGLPDTDTGGSKDAGPDNSGSDLKTPEAEQPSGDVQTEGCSIGGSSRTSMPVFAASGLLLLVAWRRRRNTR